MTNKAFQTHVLTRWDVHGCVCREVDPSAYQISVTSNFFPFRLASVSDCNWNFSHIFREDRVFKTTTVTLCRSRIAHCMLQKRSGSVQLYNGCLWTFKRR